MNHAGKSNKFDAFALTENDNYLISADGSSVTPLKEKPHVLGLAQLPDGKLIAGTSHPWVMSIDPNNPEQENILHGILLNDFSKLRTRLHFPFHDTLTNITYCGTSTGLMVIDIIRQDSVELTVLDPTRNAVEFIARTTSGLYFAGAAGLSSYSPLTGIQQQVAYRGHSFKHFLEDKDGIFWIATSGAGLLRWNPESCTVKQYDTNQGLTNNVLYAVYEDNQHMLWLTSNRGLMRFDPVTETTISFQTDDGIAHEEFNTFSHYRGKDGKFYFGGLDGLTTFHPDSIFLQNKYQPLQITALSAFDEQGTTLNILEKYRREGRIILSPSDRTFKIDFALQDFASETTDYAWRLIPDNQVWNNQRENNLRFYNLPYGNHELVIKARGSKGTWSSDILRVPINIQPPFYLRLPYQLLAISLSLLMVWFYVDQRTRRLRKEKEILRVAVERRTAELHRVNKDLSNANKTKDRLFALISHDLRTPIIAMRNISKKISYLVEKGRYNEATNIGVSADKAVGSMQALLNNLLSWSMSQLDSLPYNPQSFLVADILQTNTDLLQTSADYKGVALHVECPDLLKAYADPTGVATILRNLTDNAIKFTPSGGEIRITASSDNELVYIEVHDTGSGLSLSQQRRWNTSEAVNSTEGTAGEKGVGLGLTLSKDLAKINKGAITLVPSNSKGTIFRISLPLNLVQRTPIAD